MDDRAGQDPQDRPDSARPRSTTGQGGGGISVGEMGGLGIQFAVSIIVFLYAGQWLDRRLGTAPWFLLLFVFVGAGASFYSMYRKLMAAQAREEAALAARKAEARRAAERGE